MQDRFRVRGWSVFDSGYYDDIQNMLFGEENNMTLLDTISKGLVNEIIPEQCTGLKDKNGKLIYEGDIVEVPVLYNGIQTGKKQRCKVYYKHGAFNIYAVKSKYLKVIGNIHENSELLEGNK